MEHNKEKRIKSIPAASSILPDGRLVELLYIKGEKQTAFAIGRGEDIAIASIVKLNDGTTLIPIAPSNNLIRHDVLLFAEKPEPYVDAETLRTDIESFIHRYVDLTPTFRAIAASYVLLSWVYDAFNELPYLRLRGDFGTGKTRALTVLGALVYKAFFASGASTVSPIFYTLDRFQGTLILDEADFRFSDEKAEIVKILNNGNARGFPVLRQGITPQKEFDPRAFTVYGPKILAMRNTFDDPALESRCITEDMGQRPIRADIPLVLPDTFAREALHLRNQLLAYRFATYGSHVVDASSRDDAHSSRTNQLLIPLLSVVPDPDTQAAIRRFAYGLETELKMDRALAPEGMLLTILIELFAKTDANAVSVSAITDALRTRHGAEFDRVIVPRYVGQLLRKKLRLSTYKSCGVYVVPRTEEEKIAHLAKRFGIE